MIRLICGQKGTGKTKIILDEVDKAVASAKGDIVFISDKKINTVKVNFNVRCVIAEDYGVCTTEAFRGFVNGLVAGNSDIQYLFIDGVVRIIKDDKAGLISFVNDIKKLESEYGFNTTMTISMSVEDVPEELKPFIG